MATTNSNTIPNPLDSSKPFLTINLQHVIKLNPHNYLSWKVQIEAILIGYDLLQFIDNSLPCPTTTHIVDGTETSNPAYTYWLRQDKLLLGALLGTIHPDLVPLVSRATSSKALWDKLTQTYATPSRGHIKQLKDQLQRISKGNQSITEYMQAIKACVDRLAALGKAMDHEDIIEHVLNGLTSDYDSVVESINARDVPISFEELHEKLINKELSIQQACHTTPVPATAFNLETRKTFRHSTPTRQHLSGNTSKNTTRSPKPFLGRCQWCREQGHVLAHCPIFTQRFPNITPPQPPRHTFKPQANNLNLSSSNIAQPSSWLLDSGASHHVTNDLNNLSLHAPYDGTEELLVGDGMGLKISHIGSMYLSSLKLNNVLVVPAMTKNVISLSQLCKDNPVSITFSSNFFSIKEHKLKNTLFQGHTDQGVYMVKSVPPHTYAVSKSSSLAWHHRLGHPSLHVFKQLISRQNLNVSSLSTLDCNSCCSNKSHKLSFSTSSIISTAPLQYIYTDLWTSPLHSYDGYKYYIIFVDHFTKYIWLYPLKRKSDTKEVFIRYKALVEKFFQLPLKILYSDNGGEYEALKSYLALDGITHLTTPPHTPQHNGVSERRHRHIVETFLTLLTHAHMPLDYWPHACITAVYLINRLPTPILNNDSPFFKLFGIQPNYHKLRSFGCLCFPWLKPYTTHKLDPKSKPCVFIGYSSTQSAYHCLDIDSKRIYTSRHVHFIEDQYPFDREHSSSPQPLSLLDKWAPLSITLIHPPNTSTPPNHFTLQQQEVYPSPPNPVTSQPTATSNQTCQSHATNNSYHPMTTRLQRGITKPINKLNLNVELTDVDIPKNITQALKSTVWRQAMETEMKALIANQTWTLVPSSTSHNLVGCKWVFRIKRDQHGTITQYKARLVARGFHQREGIDYGDTFSPVVKPATVRLVLSLAVSNNWNIRQLDINNAFLQGTLTDAVYVTQPPGFVDPHHPTHVCQLKKALYGLKQAPRAWYTELKNHLITMGFRNTISDSSLFVFQDAGVIIYLLVYVDDIIVTSNATDALNKFILNLATRFSLKDLGPLSYFLGVEVLKHPKGIFLSQKRYIQDLLTKANMDGCNNIATPLPMNPPLSVNGTPLDNPTAYRALLGSLQYLSLTRPDISFAVNKLAQYMQRPTTSHWQSLHRLLRYLSGTINMGLIIHAHSPQSLHAYSDADWARDKDDYISTTAYIVYLGRNAISWASRKQKTRARSSTEAEYRAVAATTAEILWLQNLLTELGHTSPHKPTIYCDNAGATYVCANPVFHSRMKHLALDYHFVRENVQKGHLRVVYISTKDQLADPLTKPLPRAQYQTLINKIGLSNWQPILRESIKDK